MLATGLFIGGAFNPAFVAGFASSSRGRALDDIGQAITVGGVSLPFLALGVYCGYTLWQFAMRWADRIAARADARGLTFHLTVRRRPVPWAEIAALRFAARPRGLVEAKGLELRFRDSRPPLFVGAVETEGEAAERFLAFARARLAPDAEAPG